MIVRLLAPSMARSRRSSSSSRTRRSSTTNTKGSSQIADMSNKVEQQPQTISSIPTSVKPATQVSSSSSRRSSASRRRSVDTESWVERHIDELVSQTGLDSLNLTRDEYIAIFTKVVEILRGEAATIDLDTIVRRFKRNADRVLPMVASAVLELRDSLTEEQLEFVVNNIGEAVLTYASRLYAEARRLNREDLIERLRGLWRQQWVVRKYPVLPVTCPRCRFDSLMPDLTCLVCGATVSESELKSFLGFEKLLEEFAQNSPVEDVKKALSYGYVYVSSTGIKAPGNNKDVLDIEVVLTNKEKDILQEVLKRRGS